MKDTKRLIFTVSIVAAAWLVLGAAATVTRYRGVLISSSSTITNLTSVTITNSGAAKFGGDVQIVGSLTVDGIDASGSITTTDVFYGNGGGISNATASQVVSGGIVNGYLQVKSNAVASWPSAPTVPGAFAIVNSNGVVYLLTSGVGSAWTATNKIAP
jgi:hypothetical protein